MFTYLQKKKSKISVPRNRVSAIICACCNVHICVYWASFFRITATPMSTYRMRICFFPGINILNLANVYVFLPASHPHLLLMLSLCILNGFFFHSVYFSRFHSFFMWIIIGGFQREKSKLVRMKLKQKKAHITIKKQRRHQKKKEFQPNNENWNKNRRDEKRMQKSWKIVGTNREKSSHEKDERKNSGERKHTRIHNVNVLIIYCRVLVRFERARNDPVAWDHGTTLDSMAMVTNTSGIYTKPHTHMAPRAKSSWLHPSNTNTHTYSHSHFLA